METLDEILTELNSPDLQTPQSTESTEYLDFIDRRDREIKTLLRREHFLLNRLNSALATCEELRRQNKALQQQVDDLRAANAPRQSAQPTVQFSASDTLAATHGNTPRQLDRKRAPRPVDRQTIATLRNDRRYYAVACDKAVYYWQRLCDAGLVDVNLRPTPKCTVTVAARIACCFQTVVDPDIKWAFFEKYWQMKHLQTNLKRSAYKDEPKYILVNRVFERSDDADFTVKSSLAD